MSIKQGALMLVAALCLNQAQAETDVCKDNYARMEIVGQGEIEVQPDEATLSFTMEKQDKTADAVRVAVDKSVSAFMRKLKALGLSDEQLRADSNRITAVYRHDSNRNATLQGYRGSRTIQIKTDDFSKIGDITEAAMHSGINGISGYSYGLKDEKSYKVKAQLAAIEDAKAQAERLSTGFGFKIKKICQVQFNDAGMHTFRAAPMLMSNAMVRSNAKGEENVSEQAYSQDKISVKAQVNVSYCLE
ncbi:MAG: SIMPL domain-containing protein [Succinivibrio sp.]|nr:SIMPL domain-containing protein [Succinivibrio sp.]